MDSKKQRKSGNCFLTTRQLLHVSEAFHRRHGVVLDTSGVRFLEDAVNEKQVDIHNNRIIPRCLPTSDRLRHLLVPFCPS